jgi:membrane associated rhomboid family serine protease
VFIPYEVDAPFDRQPVANWLVVGGILLVFIIQSVTAEKKEVPKFASAPEDVLTSEEKPAEKPETQKLTITGPMSRFVLDGWGLGLFTYFWLQSGVFKGIARLVINLIFLWPFGNAVCAKIGNKLYPVLFIAFGIFAGVIHLIISDNPAVGAGAAISSIVGMYIVLFPENAISCLFLLPRPMAVGISGLWMVLLWFIFDILEAGASGQSTTCYAHILSLGAGAGLAVLMLKKQWVVMDKDEKSLLQVLSKEKEEIEEERKDLKALALEQSGANPPVDRTAEKPPPAPDKAKAAPAPVRTERPVAHPAANASHQKTVAVAEKTEDDFIRFKCECGHRIKVHKRDAGKAGRCPKCSRWVEAPRI